MNEKSDSYYAPQQPTTNPTPATAAAAIPPPAYSHTPQTLASASALYEYTPSDAGDLALLPNDRITITEFMNADWAKGRNERTGAEGIFPRSYVFIIDEKKAGMMAPPQSSAAVAGSSTTGYGNVPLEVSQSGGGGESKFNQQGKKFGKKMGNAGTFIALPKVDLLSTHTDVWGTWNSYLRSRRHHRLEHRQRHLLDFVPASSFFTPHSHYRTGFYTALKQAKQASSSGDTVAL